MSCPFVQPDTKGFESGKSTGIILIKLQKALYVLAISRTRFRVNPHSNTQPFGQTGQFGQMIECSFTN